MNQQQFSFIANLPIRAKLMSCFLIMIAITLLIGFFGLSYINKVGSSGEDAGIKYAPLIDAAMEIKLTATTAHLLFEEIMAGDASENIQDVWDLLEQTKWYSHAILEGGKNDKGDIVATEDPEVQRIMKDVIEKVDTFIETAHSRYDQSKTSQGVGSDADQAFDSLYEALQQGLTAWIDTAANEQAVDSIRRLGNAKYKLANGHLFLEELLSGDNENTIEAIQADFNTALKNINATNDMGAGKKQKLQTLLNKFIKTTEQRYDSFLHNSGAGSQADKNFDKSFEIFTLEAIEAETIIKHSMARAMEKITDQTNEATSAIVVIMLLSTGLGVVLSFLLARSISNPIKKALHIANTIANGDLTSDIHVTSNDEVGQLTTAMKKMNAQLLGLIGNVSSSNQELQGSAEELISISQQAGEGIQKQQSETEMAATAITQMAATVQEVARNAAEAEAATNDANQQVSTGKQVVEQTIMTINTLAAEVESASTVIANLEEQSDRVGSVLEVIGSIAEQTNLLALNAAIEAARAGEQGRGFAVVADEVRTLAQRTQESTQQIKGIIELLQKGTHDAVKAMEKGREQANDCVAQATSAGGSLDAINSAVNTISDMNAQIASASEELGAVAAEIDRNMVNINQSAEVNAENTKGLSTTGDNLSSLTFHLQDNISKFVI